jgi:hypothetical protein
MTLGLSYFIEGIDIFNIGGRDRMVVVSNVSPVNQTCFFNPIQNGTVVPVEIYLY